MFRAVSNRLEWADKVLSTQQRDNNLRFLALPNMTSLYAIHHSKMPLWEIYPLIQRPPDFEKREIIRLESFDPDIVLLSDFALDRREELRYSRTHPLTYEWIISKYKISNLNDSSNKTDSVLYIR